MTSLAPSARPSSVIKAVIWGIVMAGPSLQGKTVPKPLQAPVVRNAGPFPSRAHRLDPKTRLGAATWAPEPGTAAICKTHVWLGTFWFKKAGYPLGHPMGLLEGLVLPAPRGKILGHRWSMDHRPGINGH